MAETMRGMYGSTYNNYYADWSGLGGLFKRKKIRGKKDSAVQKTRSAAGRYQYDRFGRLEGGLDGRAAGRVVSGRRHPANRTAAAAAALPLVRPAGLGPLRREHVHPKSVKSARSAEIVKGRPIPLDLPARGKGGAGALSKNPLISLRALLLAFPAVLAALAAVILLFFNLKTSVVYGNTKYSPEQIESFITRGRLGDNTVVMALKYHNRKVEGIPFVDRIHITLVSPSTIRVNVVEKPLDGCIYYQGQNVYFSKEGTIETVSGRVAEEATRVNGIVLTHSNTGKPVLAKNQLGLDLSLEALRYMAKYGIHADEINVDEKSNLTIRFGDVDVAVGKTGYEQKIFKLHQILPHMDGKAGVISMTGFADTYRDANIVLSPKGETAEEKARAEIREKLKEAVDAVTGAAAAR